MSGARMRTSPSGREGRAGGGDGQGPSLERLYELYGEVVYAEARRRLRDHSLACDAAQEVWLSIARSLERGTRPEFPTAWVMGATRRVVARLAEERARSPVPLPGEPAAEPPEDRLLREEELRLLRQALHRLSPEDHRLLTLHYLEGKGVREISEILGMARSTVSRRIAAARRQLRLAFPRT